METVTITVTDSSSATNVVIIQTTLSTETTAAASSFSTLTAEVSSSTVATTTTQAEDAASTSTTATISVSGAGGIYCLSRKVLLGVLNPSDVTQSQAKDLTMNRAATRVEIKTSTGNCIFVDPTACDLWENLIPITIKACDGSPNQYSLTQGCMNFDPHHAAGDQVILFSCSGRADRRSQVTFPFPSANLTALYALMPENRPGVCFINNSSRLSNTDCNTASPNATELFTIGLSSVLLHCHQSEVSSSTSVVSSSTVATTMTKAEDATTTSATATISVSGAGGVFNPSDVAQSQAKDLTTTHASLDGQCLSVDTTAGDFCENLIPITITVYNSNKGQKFNFITARVDNNIANSTLIVSSLTQGCFNFDSRRAAGDQVIIFSCGGRADRSSQLTNSQLFPFTAANLTAPYASNSFVQLMFELTFFRYRLQGGQLKPV
ncbi:hypothetical protein DFH07DRAFT_1032048 [Mycena maculata]|uniref:Ricin B lectin domain-containing protein n=1 Tax=Mycena maculata TaxID=230809 RepID=A0AAD7IWD6_9AGAR|nr:hypothetical protein DFH07DRAFT_1032048 [Mycena maculata]